ncbi:MAG: tyrosine-type recombinase/integrase [Eubacteriales bacterium]|nr:tyrosine-type recombinase/integrase [Eubacteriales bacterium]
MKRKDECRIKCNAEKEFYSYLYEKECAELTIKKYCSDVQTFLNFLGEDRTVTKEKLLMYKEWLIQRYAVSSVNSMLAAINQFLEYLGMGCWKVKRIRVQRQMFAQPEKEMTQAEYYRLVQEAKSQNKVQLLLLIETMAGTGARVGELKFFTVERIKRGQIEIHLKGKYRRIMMPCDLKMKLLAFAAKNGISSGPVFITKYGNPKDRSNIWSELKALGKKANVSQKKVFPHNFRHLFARNYYKMTRDLSGLADLLGHSSLEITRIYAANSAKSYQRAINRMSVGNA